MLLQEENDIIIKQGYVQSAFEEKGMGSAYGGEWQPKKEDDRRFLGEPGQIKISVMKNGEKYATKIGKDGRAIKERHYTDHNKPWAHTNPHDHNIKWIDPMGYPNPQSPINYVGDVPDFKMHTISVKKTAEKGFIILENFETISDFKWCMHCHGEVLFEWKNKRYSITHYDGKISICEANRQETEKFYKSEEQVLEYGLANDKLKDVITKVDVIYRTV